MASETRFDAEYGAVVEPSTPLAGTGVDRGLRFDTSGVGTFEAVEC